ncbi:MAG: hypothetical protein AAF412_05160 [Pseudomonadota bacterium]
MTNAEIRLFRHGKVDFDSSGWVGADALMGEIDRYDAAPILSHSIQESEWRPDLVLCSPLRRSIDSAIAMFGRVDIADLVFKEAELPRLPALPIRLPVNSLLIMARCLWLCGASGQCEGIRSFRIRIGEAADMLMDLLSENKSAALVGHGILNQFLAHELRKREFSGPRRPSRQHGGMSIYIR